MSITKQGLLTRADRFGNDLIFLLGYTSPHFGQLKGKFNPKLTGSEISYARYDKLDEDGLGLKELPQQIADDNQNNEKFILTFLMTKLFVVAPDYNRTPLEHTPLEVESELLVQGYTSQPTYPRYFVHTAPNKDYRPLKDEEILEEDLKLFKHKVYIAGAKWSQQQGQLVLAMVRKLPYGISLIKNRHQPN